MSAIRTLKVYFAILFWWFAAQAQRAASAIANDNEQQTLSYPAKRFHQAWESLGPTAGEIISAQTRILAAFVLLITIVSLIVF